MLEWHVDDRWRGLRQVKLYTLWQFLSPSLWNHIWRDPKHFPYQQCPHSHKISVCKKCVCHLDRHPDRAIRVARKKQKKTQTFLVQFLQGCFLGVKHTTSWIRFWWQWQKRVDARCVIECNHSCAVSHSSIQRQTRQFRFWPIVHIPSIILAHLTCRGTGEPCYLRTTKAELFPASKNRCVAIEMTWDLNSRHDAGLRHFQFKVK